MKSTGLSLIASALCFSATAGAQNLIVNGNFDVNNLPDLCAYYTINTLSGWTVSYGGVQVLMCGEGIIPPMLGSTAQVYEAINRACCAVDLTSRGYAGQIQQYVPTVAGRRYQLSFYFGANPLGQCVLLPQPCTSVDDGQVKAMQVWVNGVVVQTYVGNAFLGIVNVPGPQPNPWPNPQWILGTYTFTATGDRTKIGFHSLNGLGSPVDPNGTVIASNYGPLLSNVSLVAMSDSRHE